MVDSQSAFKLLFFDLPTYPQLAQFPSVTPGSTKNSGGVQFFAVCSGRQSAASALWPLPSGREASLPG
jgi:hypothetical protein